MSKYRIFNPGPNVAKEVKPGLGIFEIPPAGSIIVEDKKLADSLVTDSGGHLSCEVLEEESLKEELPKEKTALSFFSDKSKKE